MAAKGGAGAVLRDIAKRAESFPRKFVKQAVADIRKGQTKTLKADTGGDGGLSGIGGAKLRIKTSVKGDTIVTGVVEAGSPRGPWTWLESGTKPHIAGGRYRGARHPGTRGKRTWSRAATPGLAKAAKTASREVTTIVRGR